MPLPQQPSENPDPSTVDENFSSGEHAVQKSYYLHGTKYDWREGLAFHKFKNPLHQSIVALNLFVHEYAWWKFAQSDNSSHL